MKKFATWNKTAQSIETHIGFLRKKCLNKKRAKKALKIEA